MAGAGQRLRDRGGGRAPVGAHAGAHQAASATPHFGIGADGVLLLSRATTPIRRRVRIFNPDGSEAELSGNGAREAALYLRTRGWTDADEFSILTRAGRSAPRSPDRDTATLDDGQGLRHLGRLSLRRLRRHRNTDRGRPRVALPARLDREPAVRDRRRATRSRSSTSGDRPRDRAQRPCSRTAPTSRSSGWRIDGTSPDLRARGGGDAVLRNRRQRRSGGGLLRGARRARSPCGSTAGS